MLSDPVLEPINQKMTTWVPLLEEHYRKYTKERIE